MEIGNFAADKESFHFFGTNAGYSLQGSYPVY